MDKCCRLLSRPPYLVTFNIMIKRELSRNTRPDQGSRELNILPLTAKLDVWESMQVNTTERSCPGPQTLKSKMDICTVSDLPQISLITCSAVHVNMYKIPSVFCCLHKD